MNQQPMGQCVEVWMGSSLDRLKFIWLEVWTANRLKFEQQNAVLRYSLFCFQEEHYFLALLAFQKKVDKICDSRLFAQSFQYKWSACNDTYCRSIYIIAWLLNGLLQFLAFQIKMNHGVTIAEHQRLWRVI